MRTLPVSASFALLLGCTSPSAPESAVPAVPAVPVAAAAGELEAALTVPFRGESGAARDFLVQVQTESAAPGADSGLRAHFRLELRTEFGALLRSYSGALPLGAAPARVAWDGLDAHGRPLPAGFYVARLAVRAPGTPESAPEEVQQSTFSIGTLPTPALHPFAGLPVGAQEDGAARRGLLAPLPYTVYYGNLHSQTNHTDGGEEISRCDGSEVPQRGRYRPLDAYEYARATAGLDFLVNTEHNHYYDGAIGVNSGADVTPAKQLFEGGLVTASQHRTAHPGFLASYGTEWGVISGGGHLGILNPDGLANWERNSRGALFGHYEVARNDYAAIYRLMKTRGWLGSFHHPKTGQFQIGGADLAYDRNGDDVMVLAEVANSNAYSNVTDESETSLQNFEYAYVKLLEKGYHVAPASDQDNHCANWGRSAPNRTGVLLPTGTPLTLTNFLDALRARRVFATLDKTAQLVLTTASGRVMGEQFVNRGALTLQVNYVSRAHHTAARIQLFHGVPQRTGSTALLDEGHGSYTATPSAGSHFYYAIVTQESGAKLWSAPLWVEQQ